VGTDPEADPVASLHATRRSAIGTNFSSALTWSRRRRPLRDRGRSHSHTAPVRSSWPVWTAQLRSHAYGTYGNERLGERRSLRDDLIA
jgi:hypothetical protein